MSQILMMKASMEWIDCEERLPDIDYAAHKSSSRVRIKYIEVIYSVDMHGHSFFFLYFFGLEFNNMVSLDISTNKSIN